MCGITGYFDFGGRIESGKASVLLNDMTQAIKHRGPDALAIETGKWFGVGHARLSILDLATHANQPMWCPEKRYILVYNGELYNFQSLRAELEAKGRQFQTRSDTEVILHALITWGPDALSRFEGMFAGAFVDTRENTALIFRDQLGIKPFYMTEEDGVLYFASEVKALRKAIPTPSLNEDALYEHMTYRFVAGPRTLYKNVQKLLPGHFMRIDRDGNREVKQYYDITESLKRDPVHGPNMGQIETLLNHSIRDHTVSDVGYSVQLSGGIDSSYITTLLSQTDKNIDTYSVTLPGDDLDEAPYQAQVIEKCGTTHHSFGCTGQDFADNLAEVTRTLDFPNVHTGTVFLYQLCGHIAKDHKVVLTGEGADELFLGYSRYAVPTIHKLAFRLRKAGISPALLPSLPKIRGLKNLMSRDLGLEAGSFHSDISDRLVHAAARADYRETNVKPFKSLLAQMIASDQSCYLASLLDRQDKISMAHGLEVRVPFCNHRLFDAVNPIKHSAKISPVPKAILKKLLAKYYPHDFVYRKKNGFGLPIANWIRDPKTLKPYLALLQDETFRQRGFYNTAVIDKAIEDHLNGTRDYAKELLSLFSLEIWLREV